MVVHKITAGALPRARSVASGICYLGLSVTGRQDSGKQAFAIFAPDVETLREVWDQLMPLCALDESGVQEIAIFRQQDLTAKEAL